MSAIAGAVISALPYIYQAITGGNQKSEAKDLASDANRPYNEIPPAMLQAMELNKNLALQNGIPRQDLIEEKIDQASANTLGSIKESATTPWQITAGAQGLGEMKSEQLKDVAIAGAEMKQQNVLNFTNVLQELSKLQENQFLYNEYMPYMQKMETVRALRDAGNKNIFSGLSALSVFGEQGFNEWYDKYTKSKYTDLKSSVEGTIPDLMEQIQYTAPNI